MGWLSKITKGIKNIFKGIGKVVKKAWEGVKKFASSKLGKLVIGAALVYFGGAAIGAWGGGAGTATTAATELAASTIPEAATAATNLAASTIPEVATAATGLSTAAETAAVLEGGAAAATQAATPGLISQAGTALAGAGEWMAANPAMTLAGGQMLSSAFTPSAAETQAEIDQQRRDQSNVAGVYGSGGGSPISLGLVQQAQQQDLYKPTFKPGG